LNTFTVTSCYVIPTPSPHYNCTDFTRCWDEVSGASLIKVHRRVMFLLIYCDAQENVWLYDSGYFSEEIWDAICGGILIHATLARVGVSAQILTRAYHEASCEVDRASNTLLKLTELIKDHGLSRCYKIFPKRVHYSIGVLSSSPRYTGSFTNTSCCGVRGARVLSIHCDCLVQTLCMKDDLCRAHLDVCCIPVICRHLARLNLPTSPQHYIPNENAIEGHHICCRNVSGACILHCLIVLAQTVTRMQRGTALPLTPSNRNLSSSAYTTACMVGMRAIAEL
jgi:hypothetical protein